LGLKLHHKTMTKVDVEGTPLKIGDFVWLKCKYYDTLEKAEIVEETEQTIVVKGNSGKRRVHAFTNKVLKAKD
jgi:hypothetical protein